MWFHQEPNLAPTNVRRQHFVPEWFLRQFLGTDGLLSVLDLTTGGVEERNARKVAVIPRLYDFSTD